MPNYKTLTKGFDAQKGNLTFSVHTEVYELGFYIFISENGELIDQTARKNINKAEELVNEHKHKLVKKNYTIKELGLHKVKYNQKTLTFYI